MANGASRLFNVIKNTSEGTNLNPSQVVSLTVKSTNPLVFNRDDKLDITQDFCVFSKFVDISSLSVGDVITAFVFNDGQMYFIQQNDTDVDVLDYNILSNKPKINGVELKNNKNLSDLGIMTSEVIYQDATGKKNNIPLTKSITNYDYLEIFYYREDHEYNSVKVEAIVGRTVDLKTSFGQTSGNTNLIQFGVKKIQLATDSIAAISEYYVNLTTSGVTDLGTQNAILIYKVVGYKMNT